MFHRRIHPPRKVNFKSYQLRYASKTYSQYQVTVKLLGSFRLTAGNRHLHRYCIFTEQVSETVLQSLHYSTRQNLPDKELRSSIPKRRTKSSSAGWRSMAYSLFEPCDILCVTTKQGSIFISCALFSFYRIHHTHYNNPSFSQFVLANKLRTLGSL